MNLWQQIKILSTKTALPFESPRSLRGFLETGRSFCRLSRFLCGFVVNFHLLGKHFSNIFVVFYGKVDYCHREQNCFPRPRQKNYQSVKWRSFW